MTGGLIDDEEGGFRAARDCANQIGEKAREKTRVYEGFIDLEDAYDRVNREVRDYGGAAKTLPRLRSIRIYRTDGACYCICSRALPRISTGRPVAFGEEADSSGRERPNETKLENRGVRSNTNDRRLEQRICDLSE